MAKFDGFSWERMSRFFIMKKIAAWLGRSELEGTRAEAIVPEECRGKREFAGDLDFVDGWRKMWCTCTRAQKWRGSESWFGKMIPFLWVERKWVSAHSMVGNLFSFLLYLQVLVCCGVNRKKKKEVRSGRIEEVGKVFAWISHGPMGLVLFFYFFSNIYIFLKVVFQNLIPFKNVSFWIFIKYRNWVLALSPTQLG